MEQSQEFKKKKLGKRIIFSIEHICKLQSFPQYLTDISAESAKEPDLAAFIWTCMQTTIFNI